MYLCNKNWLSGVFPMHEQSMTKTIVGICSSNKDDTWRYSNKCGTWNFDEAIELVALATPSK